jgi:uncharacterized membrane protein
MDFFAVALDDAAFLLRWAHVVAAVLMVGSAFALLKLDFAMKPRAQDPTPQSLVLHAGAGFRFLRARDADAAERALSFKWESYATWASGFALLCLVFCAAPQLYLIDPQLWNAAPWAAVAATLIPLPLTWLAYDWLCRKSGLSGDALLVALFLFSAALALALAHVFAGRAAYVLIGAHLGTLMVANIAHVVAPAQKRRLASLRAGLPADAADAKTASARALHNQYLALPTLFFMLSGHAPLLFAGPDNGVAAVFFIAGLFLIRRLWLKFSRGLGVDWRLGGVAAACLALGLGLSAPSVPKASGEARNASQAIALAVRPDNSEAQKIVDGHCIACHAARPQMAGLATAAGGLDFSTPGSIALHRGDILRVAVYSRAMPPPGAAPALGDHEKNLLIRWAQIER